MQSLILLLTLTVVGLLAALAVVGGQYRDERAARKLLEKELDAARARMKSRAWWYQQYAEFNQSTN